MRCFQNTKGVVVIVNNNITYSDTIENFIKDGGDISAEVVYDDVQEFAVISNTLYEKPLLEYEAKINKIDDYIKARNKRVEIFINPSVDELKEQKINKANAYIQSLYVGGFTSSASGTLMYYDSSTDDQSNIDKMLQASQLPIFNSMVGGVLPARGCVEKDGEKVQVQLNAQQIQQLWTDMTMHIMGIKQKGWALTDSIKDCKTVAELDAIIIG